MKYLKSISGFGELRKLENVDKCLSIVLCNNENDRLIENFCRDLVKSGCTKFICYGINSESVHDVIDDELIRENIQGITTWHVDETEEDVFILIESLPEFSSCQSIIILSHPDSKDFLKQSISNFSQLLGK